MYEHAFRVQNNMEKLAAGEESRGGSGSASRYLLRSMFKLTEEQFAALEKAALRFDPVDQDIRSRLHAAAQADKGDNLKAALISAKTEDQIRNLRAMRGRAAQGEIATIHQSLAPLTALQLEPVMNFA
jgi:hypothetical protein